MNYRCALSALLLLTTISFCDLRQADSGEHDVRTMDLFEAERTGDIAVRFIPTDAKRANVLITNQTDRVLHLELPEAIAAVPILAQFGGNRGGQGGQLGGQQFGGNGQLGGQADGGGGGTQGVGGGFDAGQGQGLGNGGGGGNRLGGGGNAFMGVMRVPPNKQRKLVARTVCLEHGKPEPNPKIAYQMIPIGSFTDDVRVANLCRDLGRGVIDPTVAQAVAWHLCNGLAWDQLAQLNRIESRYRGNIKFFNERTISKAKTLALKIASQSDAVSTSNESRSSAMSSESDYADAR